MLREECILFPPDQRVYVTEKIDGTNGRIIFTPDDSYLIGSREDLLHAKGDLLFNPAMSIVPTLKPLAEKRRNDSIDRSRLVVFFLEIYGGNVTKASKIYTNSKTFSARLFDSCMTEQASDKLTWERERISIWREEGGQIFDSPDELKTLSKTWAVPLVPEIAILNGSELPTGIEATYEWMKSLIGDTQAVIDGEGGRAEGMVVRTADRSIVAKLRFEDYERTLRKRQR
jgi:hypothetical protein